MLWGLEIKICCPRFIIDSDNIECSPRCSPSPASRLSFSVGPEPVLDRENRSQLRPEQHPQNSSTTNNVERTSEWVMLMFCCPELSYSPAFQFQISASFEAKESAWSIYIRLWSLPSDCSCFGFCILVRILGIGRQVCRVRERGLYSFLRSKHVTPPHRRTASPKVGVYLEYELMSCHRSLSVSFSVQLLAVLVQRINRYTLTTASGVGHRYPVHKATAKDHHKIRII